jgi:predicted metal-dependent hydrolase
MPIEANQIIRSRRKTLALIVKPDGSLIVRAPLRTSQNTIREFIEKNTQWIQKKQAEALAVTSPLPRQYLSGENFLYLGTDYPLEIVRDQRTALHLEECFKLAEAANGHAAEAFQLWYRQRAKELLPERVELFAEQNSFQYQRIKINSARTRWGSCSAGGSLNFSWRLMMAPLDVIDYVVVHELAHTVVHNHSRKFWKKVESILPDYKECRKWLKLHGPRLMID